MNAVIEVTRREFAINRRVTLSHLPLFLVFALVGTIAGRAAGSDGVFLLLATSVSVFFAMVYFVNAYLQQSKDKDLQFLAVLPLKKTDIVAGKFLYVVLIVVSFNGLTHSAMVPMIGDWEVCLNSFFLNSFIGVTVGMAILALFLFTSFEHLMNYSQILRGVIVVSFISLIYISRVNLTALGEILHYRPILPLGLYAGRIGLLYQVMRNRFLRKGSCL